MSATRDLDIYGPPNAAAQAMFLLDATGNDFERACGLARENAMNSADDSGFYFWAVVLKAMRIQYYLLDEGIETPKQEWN